MPKISVIIPLYNVEGYVERCARSLFNQTMDDMEYIFVDDCSMDKSIENLLLVIDEYKISEKVTVVGHPVNKGISAARNTGLKYASGDYIGWVDADDWVEKEMFQQLYQYAEINQCDFVYCGYLEERNGTSIECTEIYQGGRNSLCNLRALTANEVDAFLWNKLIKKSLFDNHKIFFPESCDMWEDFAVLVLLIYYAEHIGCVDNFLYHYTIRKDSSSLRCSEKQLNAMFKNVFFVEQFMRSIGVPEDVFLNLAERKFCIKNSLLMQTGNIEEWRILFPEVNGQIWKQKACLRIKLYEWCLLNNFDFFYFLYRKYRSIKKIIYLI